MIKVFSICGFISDGKHLCICICGAISLLLPNLYLWFKFTIFPNDVFVSVFLVLYLMWLSQPVWSSRGAGEIALIAPQGGQPQNFFINLWDSGWKMSSSTWSWDLGWKVENQTANPRFAPIHGVYTGRRPLSVLWPLTLDHLVSKKFWSLIKENPQLVHR